MIVVPVVYRLFKQVALAEYENTYCSCYDELLLIS